MKPRPWSFTHYDEFSACPRYFHNARISKEFVEERTYDQNYGVMLHTAFEHRLDHGTPLPSDLADHEPAMKKLEAIEGAGYNEYEACLSLDLKPTKFFSKDVWYRAKVDRMVVNNQLGYICDYKSGNPSYPKREQMEQNALAVFVHFPNVQAIKCEFYWTKIHKFNHSFVVMRDKQAEVWQKFLPTLGQLREAYELDLWQPRQNFRCNGWCPVKSCEYWRPPKPKK